MINLERGPVVILLVRSTAVTADLVDAILEIPGIDEVYELLGRHRLLCLCRDGTPLELRDALEAISPVDQVLHVDASPARRLPHSNDLDLGFSLGY